MPEPAYKRCSKCGETKPLDEFFRDGRAKDGRRSDCKVCNCAQVRAWRQANPERAAALSKRWAEANPERKAALNKRWREANRERVTAATQRSQARHPQKTHARYALNNAVRDGHLHKPDRCEDCGEQVEQPADLHAHHADYSKPLEVEWLCRWCHIAIHAQSTASA